MPVASGLLYLTLRGAGSQPGQRGHIHGKVMVTSGEAKAIDKVANDLDLRGGVNSPSFRVAEITVGGKKA